MKHLYNLSPLNALGNGEASTVFEKALTETLNEEFVANGTILAGAPVIMTSAGRVVTAGAGASSETIVGHALRGAVADGLVTVATKARFKLLALSGAAVNPGPVEVGSVTTNQRYVTATSAAKTVGINLTVAGAANVDIFVLVF